MNKITFKNGESGGTPINAINLNQMQDNIENAINETPTATTLTTIGNYVKYRKIGNNVEVHLAISSADITIPTGWTGVTITTLPEGYRPKHSISKRIFMAKKGSITTSYLVNYTIKVDGSIILTNLTGSEINIEYGVDFTVFSIL